MTCDKHEDLECTIREINDNILEVKEALLGTYKELGLVARIVDLETEVASLRKIKDNVGSFVLKMVASSAGGGGAVFLIMKQFWAGK